MSLQEELVKMKAQLEQEAAKEEEVAAEPVEEPKPKAESPKAEPAEPKPVDEEPEVIEPAPEDKKVYNDAMAKMRRELAAAKRQLAERQQAAVAPQHVTPQPQQQASQAAQNADPEPDVNTNPVEWVQWNVRKTESQVAELREWKEQQSRQVEHEKTIQGAVQELSRYENDFKATAEDYDDVSNFMVNELKRSFKLMHPGASEDQIVQAVQRHVLLEASRYAQQGLNPVEEMYWRAKNELGYQPKAPAAENVEQLRPDLDKIARNKARSAGMNGAAGSPQRAVPSTKEAAASMSPREWAKLTQEEKARILSS
jgi:hypothetical protein